MDIHVQQCSPQALLAYRPIRLRYCKRIGRYPLVSIVSVSADIPSMDPGLNSVESSFFFFPSSFFFPSLFQLDGSIPTRSQFYSYPFFFFSLLGFFFSPVLSSSNFPYPLKKSWGEHWVCTYIYTVCVCIMSIQPPLYIITKVLCDYLGIYFCKLLFFS